MKTDVQSYRTCMFCGLISAPQGAAMQVRGISVLVPYHHAEGASSLSGDSNSMRHSPAEKTDACMRNWLSCQGGDSWVVNPISQELEKCTHTHTHPRAHARTDGDLVLGWRLASGGLMFLCDRLLHRVGSDKSPGNRHFAPRGPTKAVLCPRPDMHRVPRLPVAPGSADSLAEQSDGRCARPRFNSPVPASRIQQPSPPWAPASDARKSRGWLPSNSYLTEGTSK